MPLVTDSRGVQIYVDDDTALGMADELLDRVETIHARSAQWGGQPSASDARRIRDDFEEAERLVGETGHMKSRFPETDLSRFYQPGESERILAERAQLKREAQTVTRAGALLGIKWTDAVSSTNGEVSEVLTTSEDQSDSSNGEQDDVVRLKRDQAAGEWVLSGKGVTTRFRNYDLAEAAARRRAGWA